MTKINLGVDAQDYSLTAAKMATGVIPTESVREAISGTKDSSNSMFYVGSNIKGTGASGAYPNNAPHHLYKNGSLLSMNGVVADGVLSLSGGGWRFINGSDTVLIDNAISAATGMIVEDPTGTGVARIKTWGGNFGPVVLEAPWQGTTTPSYSTAFKSLSLGATAQYVAKGKSIVMRSSYDSPSGSAPSSTDILEMTYTLDS